MTASRSRRVRRAITVGTVLLVGAGACAAQFNADSRSAAGSTTPHLTDVQQAAQVASALRQLPKHPERLVPDGLRSTVHTEDAVPRGTRVTPLTSTWRPQSGGTGTIRVVLRDPSGASTTYLAVMIEQHGTWRVLETVPEG